ncbi:hypothetical protein FACS1894137_07970 [Spirochaetia bacterium]|nr:hypothetical protein FACS1894137_07970 [Spirochaetia bacterium]
MRKFLVLCGVLIFAGFNYAFADISFESENGSLVINNGADFDAVVFVGHVEKGMVIGGIKAGSNRSFDISNISGLPRQGSFLVRVVSYDTYNGKKMQVTEADVVYTTLVIYDLGNINDKNVLTIPMMIDKTQTYSVTVSNNSPYILELRLDNPNGEKIAALSPYRRNKKVWLIPDERGLPYEFFPVYVHVNNRTNEATAAVSQDTSRVFPTSGGTYVRILDFYGPVYDFLQYKGGFIQVKNDTDELLNFLDGTLPLKNQRDIISVESGTIDSFEVFAGTGVNGLLYGNLSLMFDSGQLKLNPITIKPGYLYDLIATRVNGDFSYVIIDRGPKNYMKDNPIILFGE